MGLKEKLYSALWQDDFLSYEDCTPEECREFYERVQDEEPLPPDVYRVGDGSEFIRVSQDALNAEEVRLYLQLQEWKARKRLWIAVLAVGVLIALVLLFGFMLVASNLP